MPRLARVDAYTDVAALNLIILDVWSLDSKEGVACEYAGGRSANVSEKVSFLVEKTDKGVRVMVKGQPKTEEVIPLAALKESINKAAYAYTDKHVGPKEEVGNKGGRLSNRLRAVGSDHTAHWPFLLTALVEEV